MHADKNSREFDEIMKAKKTQKSLQEQGKKKPPIDQNPDSDIKYE